MDPQPPTPRSISRAPVHSAARAAQTIEHVITYGQSLAAGCAALPAISTAQPHNCLMFNAGVRTPFRVVDRPSLYRSLVPLVESVDSFCGETPTAGMLQMVNDLRYAENGISFASSRSRFLGSSPAFIGLKLADLGYGSIPFYALAENIWYGAWHAAMLRVPYRVGAVTWTQGEADYAAGTTRSAYARGMEALKSSIDFHAKGFCGQTTSPPIIQHQISSHVASGSAYPSIALAQADLANASRGFHVATPSYMMDYADLLHLTADSSKWLGAYFGLVYKRVVVDGVAWTPLQPVSARSIGTSIVAKFHVPKPPLVFDTRQVTDPGHYGFSLVAPTGAAIPIVFVSITAPDTVTIVTRQSIPDGSKLRYAFEGTAVSGRLHGPRGNLRDSRGDSLVFDPAGINKRMDSWCVIFEHPVTAAA